VTVGIQPGGGLAIPETKYAKSGGVNIAYQVLGDGPIDVVHIPPFVSNLELQWDDPFQARYLRRLASFSRLIMLDKRGTGLSDRVDVASLEDRMDDVRAVMDAADSKYAAVFGSSEGGALAILFAVTYPQRTSALVLYGAYPRLSWAPDYPRGIPASDEMLEAFETHWGRVGGGLPLAFLHPSRSDDPAFQEAVARFERLSASPGAATAVMRMILAIDVRHLLPAVRVPTLVLYRAADAVHAEGSRYIGAHISGAKTVELPGDVYFPYLGDQDGVLSEIEEFLTGARPTPLPDRVLATVLFTDIVESTRTAAEVGDQRWRALLEHHETVSQAEIQRHRGRLIKSMGDGIVATFDGPARAVRCACVIRDRLHASEIEIRAGVHTGEIELVGGDVGGIAVHIGQRVSSLAGRSEVLVSRTVVDLVAGSGIEFIDRGDHELRGVPGSWKLFAVAV
jgi:class 3 adenylate cyclase/pimeloyl-ACP methyl ester carboxylesterase